MKYWVYCASVTLLALAVTSVTLLAQGRGGGTERAATPQEYEAYQEGLRKTHLELEKQLCELLLNVEEANEVVKISLDDFNEDAFLVHKRQDVLSASTDDPAVLAAVRRACSEELLLRRHPGPLGSGTGFGGPYILGIVRIHTTKHAVTIYITNFGFVFGEEGHLPQRTFYSWVLARVVDDMVCGATSGKKRMSRELFAALSGEAVIEANKQIYWETLAAARPPDTCETE